MALAPQTQAELVRREIDLPADEPPCLVVVIDTEEEFDWHAGFDRRNTSVEVMRHIGRAQEIFDEYKIQPVYAVDWPVATQPQGYEALRDYLHGGRAVIGAHLHPWVTPPFQEEVNRLNSFPGNLPRELEAAKLRCLTDQLEETFGERPTCYKAGRYGFGANSTSVLEELGYEIDLSPAPPFDYREEGGPDFSHFSAKPYWFGNQRRLLGIPNTGAFIGFLKGETRRKAYYVANLPQWRWMRLGGVLARLGSVERLRLSPEGYELGDLERLTRSLLSDGVRTLSLSFHSTSLEPGHTEFVQTESELGHFLDRIRGYCEFFLGEIGGVARTPAELKHRLEQLEPA